MVEVKKRRSARNHAGRKADHIETRKVDGCFSAYKATVARIPAPPIMPINKKERRDNNYKEYPESVYHKLVLIKTMKDLGFTLNEIDAYFELIYLSEGAGFHWVDTQKFQIAPPVIFFLSGQLHYWEMTAIPKGYVMLFRDEFFNSLKHSDLLNLISILQDTVDVHLTRDDQLDYIFSEMEKEYKNPSTHSVELIQGYLQVALVKLLRHREQSTVQSPGGSQLVFRKFQQFLRSTNPVSNVKVNDSRAD